MTVNIRALTRIKSQALVNFPPTPTINIDFTKPYDTGLSPVPSTILFTRNDADAYATYVGPDGFIRKAAHNMVRPSAPGAGWDDVSFTLAYNTSETTAPDGSSTAGKVSDDSGASTYHYLRPSVASVAANNPYVWSAYLKKGTITVVQLTSQITTNANIWANFDLNAGTIGSKGTATTAKMISVGNGWYRCSIAGVAAADNILESVFVSGTNNSASSARFPAYTGSAGNYFYIWGTQLELNYTPSYHVVTTSVPVYSSPRLDYDPVTLQPKGMLVEEARTNILLNSSNVATAFTPYGGQTKTNNDSKTINPSGLLGATSFSETASSGQMGSFTSVSGISLSSVYTYSAYVKTIGRNFIGLNVFYGTSSGVYTTWDVSSQTPVIASSGVLGGSATLSGYTAFNVGNGWYRLSVTFSFTGNAPTLFWVTTTSTGNPSRGNYGLETYSGNTNNKIYIWGPQVELGNFASSYIPTIGSSVTRAREDVQLVGAANTIASGAVGTMFIETTDLKVKNSGLVDQILFGNATKDQLYRNVTAYPGNTNPITTYYFRTTTLASNNSVNWTGTVRSIVAFDASSVSICLAGGPVASNTGSTAMTGNTYIGSDGNGAQFIHGNIKQVILYDFKMPDDKLPIITKG